MMISRAGKSVMRSGAFRAGRARGGLGGLRAGRATAARRGSRAGKAVVGLNIEPGFIAAVQSRGERPAVERAAVAGLAADVVREGEVLDRDTLAAVLKETFREHGLGRRVRLGVANQQIVMRTLDLPPMGDYKQIASAVRFQAQEQIPMALEQAVLEHQTLGTVQTPDGPRTRVVLVAARRDMIEALLDVLRRAGLRAEGVDLAAFAMIRALHRPGEEGTTLYLSIGGVTNIALAVGARCAFTRTVTQGIEAMAAELAQRRGLTLEHAHGWLAHTGTRAETEALEGDAQIIAEARLVLTEGQRRIADEVRNSLDFYRAQEGGEVTRAVLTGPVLSIPGFIDTLGQELALRFEPGLVAEARPGALAGAPADRLAVATGLTISEVAA
jgi:type IV pilus assembly protein PilM